MVYIKHTGSLPNTALVESFKMDNIYPPRSNGNFMQKGLDYIRFIGQKTWYSNKMRFLIIFMLMLCVVNFILIYAGCMNISSSIILGNDPDGKDKPTMTQRAMSSIGNSIYLRTTQLTTMGYGDVTPSNTVGKACVSVVHLVIAFIAFNLASEYGANNTQKDMIEDAINAAIGTAPMRRRATIGDDLRNSIADVVIVDNPKTFEEVVAVADRVEERGSLIKNTMLPKIQRARDAVTQRKNAAMVVPVTAPLTPPPSPIADSDIEFTNLEALPIPSEPENSEKENGISLLM